MKFPITSISTIFNYLPTFLNLNSIQEKKKEEIPLIHQTVDVTQTHSKRNETIICTNSLTYRACLRWQIKLKLHFIPIS